MVSSRKTAVIYGAFFTLGSVCTGFVQGILGPTLLDLAEIYGLDTNEVSRVYTSRSVGMLIGAAIASLGVEERNAELVLTATLLVEGLSIALVPVLSNLWFAHAAFVFVGVAVVLFEAFSNVVLASLWKNPTLQLQLYYLGFGFGTFAIPFIAAPFLSEEGLIGNGKLQHTAASNIHLPYAGVGVLCVILGICIVTFSYFVALPLGLKVKDDPNSSDATGDRKHRFDSFETSLVLLLSSLIFFTVCVESAYTGMITPFVVQSQLRMNKGHGAFLDGVFRSTFLAGRIFTVIGYRLSLGMIISLSLAILFLSSVVLSFFVLMSPVVVWLASAGLGLGVSTLFGSSIAWTCQYVPLEHWHMALILLGACIGSSSPALFVAPWIESDPMILMYVMVGLSVILWAVFGLMMLLVRGRTGGSKGASPQVSRIHLETPPPHH